MKQVSTIVLSHGDGYDLVMVVFLEADGKYTTLKCKRIVTNVKEP